MKHQNKIQSSHYNPFRSNPGSLDAGAKAINPNSVFESDKQAMANIFFSQMNVSDSDKADLMLNPVIAQSLSNRAVSVSIFTENLKEVFYGRTVEPGQSLYGKTKKPMAGSMLFSASGEGTNNPETQALGFAATASDAAAALIWNWSDSLTLGLSSFALKGAAKLAQGTWAQAFADQIGAAERVDTKAGMIAKYTGQALGLISPLGPAALAAKGVKGGLAVAKVARSINRSAKVGKAFQKAAKARGASVAGGAAVKETSGGLSAVNKILGEAKKVHKEGSKEYYAAIGRNVARKSTDSLEKLDTALAGASGESVGLVKKLTKAAGSSRGDTVIENLEKMADLAIKVEKSIGLHTVVGAPKKLLNLKTVAGRENLLYKTRNLIKGKPKKISEGLDEAIKNSGFYPSAELKMMKAIEKDAAEKIETELMRKVFGGKGAISKSQDIYRQAADQALEGMTQSGIKVNRKVISHAKRVAEQGVAQFRAKVTGEIQEQLHYLSTEAQIQLIDRMTAGFSKAAQKGSHNVWKWGESAARNGVGGMIAQRVANHTVGMMAMGSVHRFWGTLGGTLDHEGNSVVPFGQIDRAFKTAVFGDDPSEYDHAAPHTGLWRRAVMGGLVHDAAVGAMFGAVPLVFGRSFGTFNTQHHQGLGDTGKKLKEIVVGSQTKGGAFIGDALWASTVRTEAKTVSGLKSLGNAFKSMKNWRKHLLQRGHFRAHLRKNNLPDYEKMAQTEAGAKELGRIARIAKTAGAQEHGTLKSLSGLDSTSMDLSPALIKLALNGSKEAAAKIAKTLNKDFLHWARLQAKADWNQIGSDIVRKGIIGLTTGVVSDVGATAMHVDDLDDVFKKTQLWQMIDNGSIDTYGSALMHYGLALKMTSEPWYSIQHGEGLAMRYGSISPKRLKAISTANKVRSVGRLFGHTDRNLMLDASHHDVMPFTNAADAAGKTKDLLEATQDAIVDAMGESDLNGGLGALGKVLVKGKDGGLELAKDFGADPESIHNLVTKLELGANVQQREMAEIKELKLWLHAVEGSGVEMNADSMTVIKVMKTVAEKAGKGVTGDAWVSLLGDNVASGLLKSMKKALVEKGILSSGEDFNYETMLERTIDVQSENALYGFQKGSESIGQTLLTSEVLKESGVTVDANQGAGSDRKVQKVIVVEPTDSEGNVVHSPSIDLQGESNRINDMLDAMHLTGNVITSSAEDQFHRVDYGSKEYHELADATTKSEQLFVSNFMGLTGGEGPAGEHKLKYGDNGYILQTIVNHGLRNAQKIAVNFATGRTNLAVVNNTMTGDVSSVSIENLIESINNASTQKGIIRVIDGSGDFSLPSLEAAKKSIEQLQENGKPLTEERQAELKTAFKGLHNYLNAIPGTTIHKGKFNGEGWLNVLSGSFDVTGKTQSGKKHIFSQGLNFKSFMREVVRVDLSSEADFRQGSVAKYMDWSTSRHTTWHHQSIARTLEDAGLVETSAGVGGKLTGERVLYNNKVFLTEDLITKIKKIIESRHEGNAGSLEAGNEIAKFEKLIQENVQVRNSEGNVIKNPTEIERGGGEELESNRYVSLKDILKVVLGERGNEMLGEMVSDPSVDRGKRTVEIYFNKFSEAEFGGTTRERESGTRSRRFLEGGDSNDFIESLAGIHDSIKSNAQSEFRDNLIRLEIESGDHTELVKALPIIRELAKFQSIESLGDKLKKVGFTLHMDKDRKQVIKRISFSPKNHEGKTPLARLQGLIEDLHFTNADTNAEAANRRAADAVRSSGGSVHVQTQKTILESVGIINPKDQSRFNNGVSKYWIANPTEGDSRGALRAGLLATHEDLGDASIIDGVPVRWDRFTEQQRNILVSSASTDVVYELTGGTVRRVVEDSAPSAFNEQGEILGYNNNGGNASAVTTHKMATIDFLKGVGFQKVIQIGASLKNEGGVVPKYDSNGNLSRSYTAAMDQIKDIGITFDAGANISSPEYERGWMEIEFPGSDKTYLIQTDKLSASQGGILKEVANSLRAAHENEPLSDGMRKLLSDIEFAEAAAESGSGSILDFIENTSRSEGAGATKLQRGLVSLWAIHEYGMPEVRKVIDSGESVDVMKSLAKLSTRAGLGSNPGSHNTKRPLFNEALRSARARGRLKLNSYNEDKGTVRVALVGNPENVSGEGRGRVENHNPGLGDGAAMISREFAEALKIAHGLDSDSAVLKFAMSHYGPGSGFDTLASKQLFVIATPREESLLKKIGVDVLLPENAVKVRGDRRNMKLTGAEGETISYEKAIDMLENGLEVKSSGGTHEIGVESFAYLNSITEHQQRHGFDNMQFAYSGDSSVHREFHKMRYSEIDNFVNELGGFLDEPAKMRLILRDIQGEGAKLIADENASSRPGSYTKGLEGATTAIDKYLELGGRPEDWQSTKLVVQKTLSAIIDNHILRHRGNDMTHSALIHKTPLNLGEAVLHRAAADEMIKVVSNTLMMQYNSVEEADAARDAHYGTTLSKKQGADLFSARKEPSDGSLWAPATRVDSDGSRHAVTLEAGKGNSLRILLQQQFDQIDKGELSVDVRDGNRRIPRKDALYDEKTRYATPLAQILSSVAPKEAGEARVNFINEVADIAADILGGTKIQNREQLTERIVEGLNGKAIEANRKKAFIKIYDHLAEMMDIYRESGGGSSVDYHGTVYPKKSNKLQGGMASRGAQHEFLDGLLGRYDVDARPNSGSLATLDSGGRPEKSQRGLDGISWGTEAFVHRAPSVEQGQKRAVATRGYASGGRTMLSWSDIVKMQADVDGDTVYTRNSISSKMKKFVVQHQNTFELPVKGAASYVDGITDLGGSIENGPFDSSSVSAVNHARRKHASLIGRVMNKHYVGSALGAGFKISMVDKSGRIITTIKSVKGEDGLSLTKDHMQKMINTAQEIIDAKHENIDPDALMQKLENEILGATLKRESGSSGTHDNVLKKALLSMLTDMAKIGNKVPDESSGGTRSTPYENSLLSATYIADAFKNNNLSEMFRLYVDREAKISHEDLGGFDIHLEMDKDSTHTIFERQKSIAMVGSKLMNRRLKVTIQQAEGGNLSKAIDSTVPLGGMARKKRIINNTRDVNKLYSDVIEGNEVKEDGNDMTSAEKIKLLMTGGIGDIALLPSDVSEIRAASIRDETITLLASLSQSTLSFPMQRSMAEGAAYVYNTVAEISTNTYGRKYMTPEVATEYINQTVAAFLNAARNKEEAIHRIYAIAMPEAGTMLNNGQPMSRKAYDVITINGRTILANKSNKTLLSAIQEWLVSTEVGRETLPVISKAISGMTAIRTGGAGGVQKILDTMLALGDGESVKKLLISNTKPKQNGSGEIARDLSMEEWGMISTEIENGVLVDKFNPFLWAFSTTDLLQFYTDKTVVKDARETRSLRRFKADAMRGEIEDLFEDGQSWTEIKYSTNLTPIQRLPAFGHIFRFKERSLRARYYDDLKEGKVDYESLKEKALNESFNTVKKLTNKVMVFDPESGAANAFSSAASGTSKLRKGGIGNTVRGVKIKLNEEAGPNMAKHEISDAHERGLDAIDDLLVNPMVDAALRAHGDPSVSAMANLEVMIAHRFGIDITKEFLPEDVTHRLLAVLHEFNVTAKEMKSFTELGLAEYRGQTDENGNLTPGAELFEKQVWGAKMRGRLMRNIYLPRDMADKAPVLKVIFDNMNIHRMHREGLLREANTGIKRVAQVVQKTFGLDDNDIKNITAEIERVTNQTIYANEEGNAAAVKASDNAYQELIKGNNEIGGKSAAVMMNIAALLQGVDMEGNKAIWVTDSKGEFDLTATIESRVKAMSEDLIKEVGTDKIARITQFVAEFFGLHKDTYSKVTEQAKKNYVHLLKKKSYTEDRIKGIIDKIFGDFEKVGTYFPSVRLADSAVIATMFNNAEQIPAFTPNGNVSVDAILQSLPGHVKAETGKTRHISKYNLNLLSVMSSYGEALSDFYEATSVYRDLIQMSDALGAIKYSGEAEVLEYTMAAKALANGMTDSLRPSIHKSAADKFSRALTGAMSATLLGVWNFATTKNNIIGGLGHLAARQGLSSLGRNAVKYDQVEFDAMNSREYTNIGLEDLTMVDTGPELKKYFTPDQLERRQAAASGITWLDRVADKSLLATQKYASVALKGMTFTENKLRSKSFRAGSSVEWDWITDNLQGSFLDGSTIAKRISEKANIDFIDIAEGKKMTEDGVSSVELRERRKASFNAYREWRSIRAGYETTFATQWNYHISNRSHTDRHALGRIVSQFQHYPRNWVSTAIALHGQTKNTMKASEDMYGSRLAAVRLSGATQGDRVNRAMGASPELGYAVSIGAFFAATHGLKMFGDMLGFDWEDDLSVARSATSHPFIEAPFALHKELGLPQAGDIAAKMDYKKYEQIRSKTMFGHGIPQKFMGPIPTQIIDAVGHSLVSMGVDDGSVNNHLVNLLKTTTGLNLYSDHYDKYDTEELATTVAKHLLYGAMPNYDSNKRKYSGVYNSLFNTETHASLGTAMSDLVLGVKYRGGNMKLEQPTYVGN